MFPGIFVSNFLSDLEFVIGSLGSSLKYCHKPTAILRKIFSEKLKYQPKSTKVFAYFLGASAKNLFLPGRLENKLCHHEVLRFS